MTAKTDRELLELAAKAAGYWSAIFNCPAKLPRPGWDPLGDDGDALRLAVKLHLEIDHNHPMDNDAWVMVRVNGRLDGHTEEIDGEAGRPAATRRAIVRTAAAIGEAKP